MTSSDPGDDLVPCMRSVQLSDGDKQLMSAFKNKVDGETDQYLHSESDPRYKGAHIPSRTFRILQAATGGPDGVSGGGAPPAATRIGGPGQNRTVVVTMPTGGASGPAVPPSQQEVPEPRKYTGGNIPSRSFRVLQQMTADQQALRQLGLPSAARLHNWRPSLLHVDRPAASTSARSTTSASAGRTGRTGAGRAVDGADRSTGGAAGSRRGEGAGRAASESATVRTSRDTGRGAVSVTTGRQNLWRSEDDSPAHSRLRRLLFPACGEEEDAVLKRREYGRTSSSWMKRGGKGGMRDTAATTASAVAAGGSTASSAAFGDKDVDDSGQRRHLWKIHGEPVRRAGRLGIINPSRSSTDTREADVSYAGRANVKDASPVSDRGFPASTSGGRGVRMSSINSIGSISSVSSGFGDAEEMVSEPEDEMTVRGEVLDGPSLVPAHGPSLTDRDHNDGSGSNSGSGGGATGGTLRLEDQEAVGSRDFWAELTRDRLADCRQDHRRNGTLKTVEGGQNGNVSDVTCEESDSDTDPDTDSDSESTSDSDSCSESESCSRSDAGRDDVEETGRNGLERVSQSADDQPSSSEEDDDDEDESTMTSDGDVTEDEVTLVRSRPETPVSSSVSTGRSLKGQDKCTASVTLNRPGDGKIKVRSSGREAFEDNNRQEDEEEDQNDNSESHHPQNREDLEAIVADIWGSREDFNAGENDGELLFRDKREREYDDWLERLERRNERLKTLVAPPTDIDGTRAALPSSVAGFRDEEVNASDDVGERSDEGDESVDDDDDENSGESDEDNERSGSDGTEDEAEQSSEENDEIEDRIVNTVVGSVLSLASDAVSCKDSESQKNEVPSRCIERDKDHIDGSEIMANGISGLNIESNSRNCNNVSKDNVCRIRVKISVDSKGVQTDDIFTNMGYDPGSYARPRTAPCKKHVPHVIISTPDSELNVDVLLGNPDAERELNGCGSYEVWGECYSKIFRPQPLGYLGGRSVGTNNRFAGPNGASAALVKDSPSEVKDSFSEVKDFVAKVKASPFYATDGPLGLQSSHASMKAPCSVQSQSGSRRKDHVTFQSALRFFRDQTEIARGDVRQMAARSPGSAQRAAPSWLGSSRPSYVPP